ncbi:hypothetical protein HaLaN_14282 [Haematococcus lacustris]|uniref:Uncharacterized protein n=1 Tax=Haematococcus lacustris TaxID=44745 RepID=A0A699Z4X3_HAELA|nr:hypothetical protein HaLaN_14282 [Haematococcus lacustris]
MKGVQGGGAASEGGQGQGPALLPPYGWLTEAGREAAWQLGEYACSLRDQLHTGHGGSMLQLGKESRREGLGHRPPHHPLAVEGNGGQGGRHCSHCQFRSPWAEQQLQLDLQAWVDPDPVPLTPGL